jgi:hypothetical protein
VRRNALPNPNSPDKQLQPRWLQRIAELGILTKPAPINAPAKNTHSRTQVRTITQEATLACILTYSDITNLRLTAANAARQKFPLEMLNAVLNMDTGKLMEMKHLLVNPKYKEVWGKLYTTELGRLAHGIPGVSKGTDTIIFILRDEVPIDRIKDVTYGCVCINYRPEKDDPNQICLTIGGDRVNYPGNCGTPTVNMVTVKLHLNSVILKTGACYCAIDLKDFYLMTPMAPPEFMCTKIKALPAKIIELYKLNNKATSDGFIFIKNQKGMYGLPQAGILAQELLEKRLNKHAISRAHSH